MSREITRDNDARPRDAAHERRALKWLAIIVPPFVVYGYETVRHDLLEHTLPVGYGNLLVGLLTLVCSAAFATLLFSRMDELERRSVRRERELASIGASARERERLSRELHDGLAQLVASLLIRIDTLVALVSNNQKEPAVAELERLRQVADDLYVDVRESIGALRTEICDRRLDEVLTDYLDTFEDRNRIVCSLEVHGDMSRIPPTSSYELFRIVQEALSNVRKHAVAHQVDVVIAERGDELMSLTVRDDGRGFCTGGSGSRSPQGIGLRSMNERAQSIGAHLQVLSRPSSGTTVQVEFRSGVGECRAAAPAG